MSDRISAPDLSSGHPVPRRAMAGARAEVPVDHESRVMPVVPEYSAEPSAPVVGGSPVVPLASYETDPALAPSHRQISPAPPPVLAVPVAPNVAGPQTPPSLGLTTRLPRIAALTGRLPRVTAPKLPSHAQTALQPPTAGPGAPLPPVRASLPNPPEPSAFAPVSAYPPEPSAFAPVSAYPPEQSAFAPVSAYPPPPDAPLAGLETSVPVFEPVSPTQPPPPPGSPMPPPPVLPPDGPNGPRRGARHSADVEGEPAPKKANKVVKRLGIVLLALVVALIGSIAYFVLSLSGRFGGGSVDPMLPNADRPTDVASTSGEKSQYDPYGGRAMNILVLGSDTRSGDNSAIVGDDVGGGRSDTVFILHVSADRSRVDVVSIPRDTMVTIPQCYYADDSKVPYTGGSGQQKFNAAFSWGSAGAKGTSETGVACAIRTVEAITKVRINGYVLIDFTGFAKIVNSVGGVDLFLPCAINSPDADNLSLPAGVNHMNGDTALEYARARKGTGLGDGSDLMRIKRQQALFTALAYKVLHLDMITNIGMLYNFVGSVGDSITTDLGNGLSLAGFAYSLRNLSPGSLTFSTVPIAGAGDGVNVVIVQSKATPIFHALSYDLPIPGTNPDSADPSGDSDESPVPATTAATTPGVLPATTAPTASPNVSALPTTTSSSPYLPSTTTPATTAPTTTKSTPASTKSPTAPPDVVSAPLGQC